MLRSSGCPPPPLARAEVEMTSRRYEIDQIQDDVEEMETCLLEIYIDGKYIDEAQCRGLAWQLLIFSMERHVNTVMIATI